ncbi:hypothetical protein F2P81_005560 [Scophthalmus maximus]|uniref:Uncharacterized protein n=1 Tax=Scophthalmus maximus TaxID=52904 RepID=A0A6A4TCA2_SCOMX|nr:hypothetical protein F2P81_005560 [Scophthalmus maximus]
MPLRCSVRRYYVPFYGLVTFKYMHFHVRIMDLDIETYEKRKKNPRFAQSGSITNGESNRLGLLCPCPFDDLLKIDEQNTPGSGKIPSLPRHHDGTIQYLHIDIVTDVVNMSGTPKDHRHVQTKKSFFYKSMCTCTVSVAEYFSFLLHHYSAEHQIFNCSKVLRDWAYFFGSIEPKNCESLKIHQRRPPLSLNRREGQENNLFTGFRSQPAQVSGRDPERAVVNFDHESGILFVSYQHNCVWNCTRISSAFKPVYVFCFVLSVCVSHMPEAGGYGVAVWLELIADFKAEQTLLQDRPGVLSSVSGKLVFGKSQNVFSSSWRLYYRTVRLIPVYKPSAADGPSSHASTATNDRADEFAQGLNICTTRDGLILRGNAHFRTRTHVGCLCLRGRVSVWPFDMWTVTLNPK